MKVLRTPLDISHRLSEVNLRVKLDGGRVCLELTGFRASVLYNFQAFFDEIGGRGVRGPDPFAERARVQVITAPLLIRAIALFPYNGGLFELEESSPAIRGGVQMCGQNYTLDDAGPYIAL